MQRSIDTHNKLHECSRGAMSIEEANTHGCSFQDNEATQKAFIDFEHDYNQFCAEQNTVDGEPFSQEPPTIKHYLMLHKATKKAHRKLKIGVTAPPVMDFAIRAPRASDAPSQTFHKAFPKSVASESLLKKVSTKKELRKATPIDFETYLKQEPSLAGMDLFFFMPLKGKYEAEMGKAPLPFAQRHAFPNPQKVIAKIKQWRQLMQGNDMKKASGITIRSLDGTDRAIGSVAFSFKSFDKCCASDGKTLVALMCNYLKQ
jgi:hypothetical protein